MEIEFAFRKERSKVFGDILRPVAKLTVSYHNYEVPEIFYVDSGADVTLIPRSVGEILRLENPKASEIFDIMGIGEKGVPIVLRTVELILNDRKISTRIGWALTEDVPLLLGREDFFKYCQVLFVKNKKTVFIF